MMKICEFFEQIGVLGLARIGQQPAQSKPSNAQ